MTSAARKTIHDILYFQEQPAATHDAFIDAKARELFASGLYAGTHLLTARGPVAVEALQPGDRVETFDHGLQPITALARFTLRSAGLELPRALWPVLIPRGLMGNDKALRVPPEQGVLIESDQAEAEFGDPFVMIPAATGITLPFIEQIRPDPDQQIVHLKFARPELVVTRAGGVFLCGAASLLDDWAEDEAAPAYTVLPLDYARELMAREIEEDGGPAQHVAKLVSRMQNRL